MSFRTRLTIVIFGTAAIIAVVAVVLVLLVFGNGDADEKLERASITVEEVINRVETDSSQDPAAIEKEFLPAQVGQGLSPGDSVKTFPESEARVDIVIRALTRITRSTPNTIWRLGQFALEDNTIIELTQGKIFLIDEGTEEGIGPIEVVTPAGTASPRGTWMSVEYDPDEGVTEVQCFRGLCELENDLGKQVLTDEEKSTATADTAPAVPELMEQEEKLEFVELPEAKSGEVVVPTPEVVPPSPTLAATATAIPLPTATQAPIPTSAPLPSPIASVQTPTPGPTSAPPAPPLPTLARAAQANPTPEPEVQATPIPQPTLKPTPVATPEPTLTPNPTPTPMPTTTPTPTPTPTPVPTATPTSEPLPPVKNTVVPHAFVGTVTIDGVIAPDGTVVTVWIQEFSAPVDQAVVSDGSYLIQVPQYGSASFAGKTVTFKVGSLNARETAIWMSLSVDELNLTAFN